MTGPSGAQLEARRGAVVARLRERGLAGLLVTTLVNVRYLTGFTGSNGALLLPVDGSGVFLTDGRYQDQAVSEVPGLELLVTRDLVGEGGRRMAGSSDPWAVETHTLSVDDHSRLDEHEVASAERVVESVREVKDEHEVEALRQACAISVEALGAVLDGPLVGRTERDVARDLEWRMLTLGAEAIAFETILASGPHSAVPHHHPTDRVIERGDLLKIDFGARVAGYHADCTRTVVLGPPADWQREIHAAVRAAQAAGVDALVEGAVVADVDALVRGSLEAAGWLERFTTGLGHGVGLQIHEDPFFGASNAGRLAHRTTLTMEPGIYLPGRGGVRIEDTVLVTSQGQRPVVLTEFPTDLLEIA